MVGHAGGSLRDMSGDAARNAAHPWCTLRKAGSHSWGAHVRRCLPIKGSPPDADAGHPAGSGRRDPCNNGHRRRLPPRRRPTSLTGGSHTRPRVTGSCHGLERAAFRVRHTVAMDTRHIPRSSISARCNPSDQVVDLVVDGRAVIDIVDPEHHWGGVSPFARRFGRTTVQRWLAEYQGTVGDRDKRLSAEELEIAVCGACGDLDCGNLAVDLHIGPDSVVWRAPHWAGAPVEDDDEPTANDPTTLLPPVLVFDRAEYEAALSDTAQFVARDGWQRRPQEGTSWRDRLRNRFTRPWQK